MKEFVLIFILLSFNFSHAKHNKCYCRFSYSPRLPNGNTVVPNGCGAATKGDLVPELWFHSCCVKHDLCYGLCSSDKVICDAEFYLCMKNECKGRKLAEKLICDATAAWYNMFVEGLGCKAWIRSQNLYCNIPCF